MKAQFPLLAHPPFSAGQEYMSASREALLRNVSYEATLLDRCCNQIGFRNSSTIAIQMDNSQLACCLQHTLKFLGGAYVDAPGKFKLRVISQKAKTMSTKLLIPECYSEMFSHNWCIDVADLVDRSQDSDDDRQFGGASPKTSPPAC